MRPREDLITRMREARAKPMRDHEKLGPYSKFRTLNKLWDYEISDGALGGAIGAFHKGQIV